MGRARLWRRRDAQTSCGAWVRIIGQSGHRVVASLRSAIYLLDQIGQLPDVPLDLARGEDQPAFVACGDLHGLTRKHEEALGLFVGHGPPPW